jgi:hypothetical protein
MNGITWILGLSVTAHIDVRLSGKRSGFDFDTQLWPTNDYASIKALCTEIAVNARDLNYADNLEIQSLFVYVEKPASEGEVLKLERIEDVTAIEENVRIRIQLWSDFVCESGKLDGELPTLQRMAE